MAEMKGCGCEDFAVCVKSFEEQAEVSTPLSVRIDARIGDVEMCCKSEPTLVTTDCGDGCKLLVIQRLNLRIPMKYEASVVAEKSDITCAKDC